VIFFCGVGGNLQVEKKQTAKEMVGAQWQWGYSIIKQKDYISNMLI